VRYGRTIAGTYFLRRGLYLPEELGSVVDPDIVRDGLAGYDPVTDAARLLSPRGDGWTSVHLLESRLYMRNQLLRDADWASMAHSLELRVPFVDVPLRAAAAAARFEPARSRGKVAVAREVAPELPGRTLSRFKSGFMIPGWKPPRLSASPQAWGLQSRARALEVLRHFGVTVLSSPRAAPVR
jgi:asparagine synthase (glutamine-hydrolysing)